MTSRPDSLLVVTDAPTYRDLMIHRLSTEGFNVSAVVDGKSAIKWVEENPVDLMILDDEMPGTSGLELLTALRGKYDQVKMPVIMATGNPDSEHILEALNTGANDFITKPVDIAVTLARIQTQLSRKRAEEALRESEERYTLAAIGANDGLWDWQLRTNSISFSLRWKSMLGYEADEIGEKPDEWFKRIHPDDVHRVHADIGAHLEKLTPHFEGEYRIQHKDGNYLWMMGRGIALRNNRGNAYRMAGSQTDITRGKVVDVLTGLPNRELFMDRLGRCFSRAKRSGYKSFALIFLDLDSFKLINDNLGHLIGDQMLVTIASRLESTIRSCDSISRFGRNHTIARLGGDEFTILLDDISSSREVTNVAERIAAELSEPFVVNNQELFPTASIGIAIYNPNYKTPEEILRDADTAMYSAKALGKGHYEIFDSTMRANEVARIQLENELRRGIERHEFEVYYQPVVALVTKEIIGFEALIRWNHATQGTIFPDEFIPVAEETGLIIPLGQWVFETACQQARIWQTRFAATPLSIHINISARHFLQSDLVEYCQTVLRKTQLSENSLVLEVTESAMMPDPDTAIEVMRQLKTFGIQLAMDDFGTGYSSLSHLHRFPLDCLKIDESFIARMLEDDEIIHTIITLGKKLGLQVIAEGVETTGQLEKLLQLGCEYAQGYTFSIPVNASEATDLLMANHPLPPASDTVFGEYSILTD